MNTTKIDGIEIYEHDIYYYADEYIQAELKGDEELVKSRFVAMIYYIRDRIPKPGNDNIELLDKIFDVYCQLCAKYSVLPTLEVFSFLVSIHRLTFHDWEHEEYRTSSAHGYTVKKWKDVCRSFTVDRLHNRGGTDANLIFIAKAAYGMRETAPEGLPDNTQRPAISMEELHRRRQEIAQRYAEYREMPEKPDFD